MNYVGKLFSTSRKGQNLFFHLIVLDDIKEIFLIFFTIEESESNTGVAKSARPSNTMQVAFIVWEMMLWWNIKIDDELYGMHVKSTREQICCYDHIDWTLSELLYAVISFLFRQIAKHNEASVALFIEAVVNFFGKLFGVHENDSLSVIFERIEDFHDVLNLSASLALMIELLNVV